MHFLCNTILPRQSRLTAAFRFIDSSGMQECNCFCACLLKLCVVSRSERSLKGKCKYAERTGALVIAPAHFLTASIYDVNCVINPTDQRHAA